MSLSRIGILKQSPESMEGAHERNISSAEKEILCMVVSGLLRRPVALQPRSSQ